MSIVLGKAGDTPYSCDTYASKCDDCGKLCGASALTEEGARHWARESLWESCGHCKVDLCPRCRELRERE